ncbi:nucleic acid/nucleotide deaminase domain-containing protein [Paractinoplanes toevensis]|uniref:Uncharacterized protein n=1 Tax=Paractinoplanes toevensis TaxID=571911 RepID=A0A919T635_9ACTN|nr:nucleic acid/nucleotide deaminase domain-containing protein [Actinoplanes toevensis]GIM89362.1 hypothetical protein Ato02nite_011550 [Actinoplanes toevensis]
MENLVKERSRVALFTRLAAVLVLIWSVIGGVPAAAHAGARVVADWPIIDARCAPVTPQGLVGYGCTKLGVYMQEARLDLRYNRPPKTTDKLYTNVRGNYAIAQLKDGTYIIGHSDGLKHAEERLLDQMEGKSQRVVFDPKTGKVSYQPAKASPIVEGFSELEPCDTKCDRALKDAKVRDKFTYSYKWNPEAGENRKAVQDAANNRVTGVKQVAVRELLDVEKKSGPILPKSPEELAKGSAIGKAAGKQMGPIRPGGIDFSSVQLRYVTDGGTSGNTYSFETGTTPGQESKDGTDQIYGAGEALDTWMAVEPSRFWVNLNPSQPDKVIDQYLGKTEVGRVLLEADLELKRAWTRFQDPKTAVGLEYWNRMTGLDGACIRQWIVPRTATIREEGDRLYILEAPLEVKAEAFDFTIPSDPSFKCPANPDPSMKVYNDLLLPELNKAVNNAPEFKDLRRVYISRVAAEWYRDRMTADGRAAAEGIDSNDVSTLERADDWSPTDVFNQYLKEIYGTTYELPNGVKVTTGGVDFTQPVKTTKLNDTAFKEQHATLPTTVDKSLTEVTKTSDEKQAYLGGKDEIPVFVSLNKATPAPSGTAGGPGDGDDGGEGGGLPITGAPIFTIAAAGLLLILIGMAAVWRTRRVRWVAKK